MDAENYEDQLNDRPRSRMILQELAAQEETGELEPFQHIKKRISTNALRGIGVLVCALILSSFFLQFLKNNTAVSSPEVVSSPLTNETVSTQTTATEPATVYVHVAGAVTSPGVYELKFGERIYDAVQKAGGTLPEAQLDAINLAQPIADGQQIYIPREGEQAATSEAGGTTSAAESGLININTASASDLEELPRVGPATAQKIVEYRQSHGKFQQLEDLLEIPGIGEKTLQNFEGLVTF